MIMLIIAMIFSYRLSLIFEKKEFGDLYYHTNSGTLKLLSAGNEELIADALWLQFIQIYGDHLQKKTKFKDMDLLLNTIVDIDPHFLHTYTFGSISLAYHLKKYKEAEKLIWKGIVNNPEKWEYLFWYGFLNYTVFNKHLKAGKFFWLASLKQGAPDMTKRWAAFVFYKKVGNLQLSLRMWENLYKTSKNKFEKEIAKIYIKKIKQKIYRRIYE